jgi:hypothetical protein
MSVGERWYFKNNPGNVYNADAIVPRPAGVACVLYSVIAQNLTETEAGGLWLMVFDTNALPIAGAIPDYSLFVADGSTLALAPPAGPNDSGRPFNSGVFVTWNESEIFAPAAGPFGNSLIHIAGRYTA